MIRILLVDDHHAFREPMAFLLGLESDMTVRGQASSVAEALPLLDQCDVAVVDIDLPDGSGVDVVRALRTANPRGQALVLTGSASRKELARAVEAGAAGLMHKTARIPEIIAAVRRLAAGESLLASRELWEMLRLAQDQRAEDSAMRERVAQLTAREREVLQAIAEGLSDKEIAERLGLSPQTARKHVMNILGKLDVESRLQALIAALRYRVVTID